MLIELDPTINDAELAHLQGDLMAPQLDVARLRAALAEHDDPLTEFRPPEGASPALVAMQRQFLLSQIGEHRAKLAALDAPAASRRRPSAPPSRRRSPSSRRRIPILQQRVDIRKTLSDKELGSKLQYLEMHPAAGRDSSRSSPSRRAATTRPTAALTALVETQAQAIAEYRRTLFDELAEAERKAAGLRQDLVKAEQRTKLQLLTAPVDGIVQQLAVHTIGGVVTPAQTLLVVVPTDSQLEIEAMVSNRDIGFVQAGQEAEIKVDTFNFTRYGLLHGTVLSVSQDAIIRDKPLDKPSDKAQGTESSTQRAAGPGAGLSRRASRSTARRCRSTTDLVNLRPAWR